MKNLIAILVYMIIFNYCINSVQKKLSKNDNLILFSRNPIHLIVAWISSLFLVGLIIWFSISKLEIISALLLIANLLLLLNALFAFEGYTDEGILQYRFLKKKVEMAKYSDIENVILQIRKQKAQNFLSYKIILKNGNTITIGTQFASFGIDELRKVDSLISKYSKISIDQHYSETQIASINKAFGDFLRKKIMDR